MVSCLFGSDLVVAWVPYPSAAMSSMLPFASSDRRLTLRIAALPRITLLTNGQPFDSGCYDCLLWCIQYLRFGLNESFEELQ
jgi:hypothetical protein